MKIFLKVITLAVAVATFSTVQAAEQKIGVVFPSKVIEASPQRARTDKTLEREFKGRYEKLQAQEKEITKLQEKMKKDGELLSKQKLTDIQRDLAGKVSDYKLKRRAFEEDQQRRTREEQQKILTSVRDAIASVAKKGNYDIVLNGEQIVFSKPALDISDSVIKVISKK